MQVESVDGSSGIFSHLGLDIIGLILLLLVFGFSSMLECFYCQSITVFERLQNESDERLFVLVNVRF